MPLLSTSIFAFLVIVNVSSSEDFTNGASYLYPRMGPTVSLADKFDIIRNTDFVRNLTIARKMTRTTKLENLEQWLRGYSIDKYDLINMYDRMLSIQTKVKYSMKFYLNRVALLEVELMRGNLSKIIGKQDKMNYVKSFRYHSETDNYFKPSYFSSDIDWEQKYNSNKFLPAHQVFFDYYFSTTIQRILNNTNRTVEKRMETIDKMYFPMTYFNGEDELQRQYYLNYMTKNNETLLECTE